MWLAELGPMFFSVKESTKDYVAKRKFEKEKLKEMEEELNLKFEEDKKKEKEEEFERIQSAQRSMKIATPGRSIRPQTPSTNSSSSSSSSTPKLIRPFTPRRFGL